MTPGVRLRLARARIILVKIRSRFLKEAKIACERNELLKWQAELKDITSDDASDDGSGAACSSQSTLVMGPGGVVQAKVEQAAEDHWERPFFMSPRSRPAVAGRMVKTRWPQVIN